MITITKYDNGWWYTAKLGAVYAEGWVAGSKTDARRVARKALNRLQISHSIKKGE